MQRGMALEFRTVTGPALQAHLPDLARLRCAVFREWPYLYEGDESHESDYLRAYAQAPGAAVIVALEGDRAVGAATCQPMAGTHRAVRDAFAAAGLDPSAWCYFGESVLQPAWRGQGAGVRFFAERERHAAALGLDLTAFCAVERDPADPRRPAGYQPLDGFWRRRGYAPRPGLACRFDWQEIGAAAETPHRLPFWVKSLAGRELP
jgi:GNAT superfamily N-acetyltransferase